MVKNSPQVYGKIPSFLAGFMLLGRGRHKFPKISAASRSHWSENGERIPRIKPEIVLFRGYIRNFHGAKLRFLWKELKNSDEISVQPHGV